MLVIDLDEESQLASTAQGGYLELSREELLLAADLDEELLDLVMDQLLLSLGTKVCIVELARLGCTHQERWVSDPLVLHEFINLVRVKIEELKELNR